MINTTLNKAIEQAIMKAIQQRITTDVESFVRGEVLRKLKTTANIQVRKTATERLNKDVILVEKDVRRNVGKLVLNRTVAATKTSLRFKLEGLKARVKEDVIDQKQLQKAISEAVAKKIRAGIFTRT
jgi:hypothetical protein